MIVACPACQARYEVDASRLRGGRGRLRCARCKAVFPVETPDAPGPSMRGAAKAAAAAEPEATRPARRLDVALVAMEPGSVRDSILALLAEERVRTLTAADGEGALDAVRRSRPALAVLAHRLAGMLGPEVAHAVQSDPALAGVRIVLVGGPPSRAKMGASATAALGVEGHLDAAADPATMRQILFGALGHETADGPGRDELSRLAWLAASDAGLYHPALVAEARRSKRRTAALEALLERARQGCFERHPELRLIPGGVDPFVEELERALGVRP